MAASTSTAPSSASTTTGTRRIMARTCCRPTSSCAATSATRERRTCCPPSRRQARASSATTRAAPRAAALRDARSEAEVDARDIAVDPDAVVLFPLGEHAPLRREPPARAEAVDRLGLPLVLVVRREVERAVRIHRQLRVRDAEATVEIELLQGDDAHEGDPDRVRAAR